MSVEGRKIAATFWGKAWCDNLESYRDYENRLERGRSYVRNGSGDRSADRAAHGDGDGQRVIGLHRQDHDSEVPKPQWKSICAIAPAASIRLWNCCKAGFPKA